MCYESTHLIGKCLPTFCKKKRKVGKLGRRKNGMRYMVGRQGAFAHSGLTKAYHWPYPDDYRKKGYCFTLKNWYRSHSFL